MLVPNRHGSSDSYRYGFNGKEKDDEIKGEGTQYDYGFRIYDPRIGKFLSPDPLFKGYPWYTPYQFAGNKPIACIDLDGLEEIHIIVEKYFDDGTAEVSVVRTSTSNSNNGAGMKYVYFDRDHVTGGLKQMDKDKYDPKSDIESIIGPTVRVSFDPSAKTANNDSANYTFEISKHTVSHSNVKLLNTGISIVNGNEHGDYQLDRNVEEAYTLTSFKAITPITIGLSTESSGGGGYGEASSFLHDFVDGEIAKMDVKLSEINQTRDLVSEASFTANPQVYNELGGFEKGVKVITDYFQQIYPNATVTTKDIKNQKTPSDSGSGPQVNIKSQRISPKELSKKED